MKKQTDIEERIKDLSKIVLSDKVKYMQREKAVNWIHALSWVLEDENMAIKKRLNEIKTGELNGNVKGSDRERSESK